jgi:hypothetical protein
MKKVILPAMAALAISASAAIAADMPVKAPAAVVAAPSPWDIAWGGGIVSDYMWRGITQSNHQPSVTAYFEPRYNVSKNLQLYVGLSGESIAFANRAAAEIDVYGGIRPTFGPLALDFGVWGYLYPGGKLYDGLNLGRCTNGQVIPFLACNLSKSDVSFYEVYAKGVWTVNDNFAFGGNFYYTPDYLQTGTDGEYASVTAKFTGNALPNGVNWYISAEFGRQWLGTTDAFYGNILLPDYNTWNAGIGMTYKVFTVDLRYSDTDLTTAECNAITSDFTSSGLTSKWCGSTFIATVRADMTLDSLK